MTWNLASMRGDMNADDPLGGLGPRVEKAPAPAPAPVSRGDGFLVHPDGTLSTEIEPPSGPPPAPAPAEPEPIASAPAPLKVGDKVRLIGESIWQSAYLGRLGLVVTADEMMIEIAVDGDSGGPVRSRLEYEGREWERT